MHKGTHPAGVVRLVSVYLGLGGPSGGRVHAFAAKNTAQIHLAVLAVVVAQDSMNQPAAQTRPVSTRQCLDRSSAFALRVIRRGSSCAATWLTPTGTAAGLGDGQHLVLGYKAAALLAPSGLGARLCSLPTTAASAGWPNSAPCDRTPRPVQPPSAWAAPLRRRPWILHQCRHRCGSIGEQQHLCRRPRRCGRGPAHTAQRRHSRRPVRNAQYLVPDQHAPAQDAHAASDHLTSQTSPRCNARTAARARQQAWATMAMT